MMMRGMRFTALALVLTGCVNTVPPGGYGVRAIQFSDVVVPDGMKLRQKKGESYTHEAGTWRAGHLVYGGSVTVAAISTHVLDRMPRHAWDLIEDQAPNGQSRMLRFARGQYIAEYTIRRQENLTLMIVDYSTASPGRP